jgi:hypothetical protein
VQLKPAIPNKIKEGTSTFFLPSLSAITPRTGVNNTPGRVKTVINNPTCCDDKPNCRAILGKAGVILETPSTAINVTLKVISRFLLNKSPEFFIKTNRMPLKILTKLRFYSIEKKTVVK